MLPLNCGDYAEFLEGYLNTAVEEYGDRLQKQKISMGKGKTLTYNAHWPKHLQALSLIIPESLWRSVSVSEPLKRAVASFRTAADNLDNLIKNSDLAKET